MKIIRVLLVSVLSAAVVAVGPGAEAGAVTSGSASASMAADTRAAVSAPRLTRLVAEAVHQTTLGISYLYAGGHGARPAPLNSHVDCSGFVRELYNYAFGVDIGSGPADNIRTSGKFTRTSHPVPGDVALFGNNNSAPAFHSGIYVGNVNGHPAMVAAPATGQNIKMQLGLDQYWAPLIMGYWHFRGATAADSSTAERPQVRGSFDAAGGGRRLFGVTGWSVDMAVPWASNVVRVVVDGRTVTGLRAGSVRADVDRVLRIPGRHGFSSLVAAIPGRHTVCLVSMPLVGTSVARGLGCKVVTVSG